MSAPAYYCNRDGQTAGPMTIIQLKQLVVSGRIRPTDLVWREDTPEWVPAGQVGFLFSPEPATAQRLPQSRLAYVEANGAVSAAAHSLATGRTKAVLVIGLIVFAGICFALLRPTSTRSNIERVLRQDAEIGEAVGRQLGLADVAWDQSEAVERIVAGMRQIDLAGCPDDFRAAYLRHLAAWTAYQQVAHNYGGWRGFIMGFMTGGASVVPALSNGLQAEQAVYATFQEVLFVAKKHGVTPKAKQ